MTAPTASAAGERDVSPARATQVAARSMRRCRTIRGMTDFRVVRAITVPAGVSIQYAEQRVRDNDIYLLLVTDDRNVILGLIT